MNWASPANGGDLDIINAVQVWSQDIINAVQVWSNWV